MKLDQLKQILVIGTGLMFFSQHVCSQASCSSDGETFNGSIFGPATFAIGDFTVKGGGVDPLNVNDADLFLSGTANVDIFAAVDIASGAVMRLKSGSILNIYGNVNNNGFLFLEPGATINFYGDTWKNASTTTVGDGIAATNTQPGGAINFIAPRPVIPSSVNASTCVMNNYSGGNFMQKLDGGNVPMDIALHIQNANNIQLVNTNARLEGTLVFDVNSGDLDLKNQIVNFTSNGNWSTNVAPNQAYILTNGTISCNGKVIKHRLESGVAFTFPVGTVETDLDVRDYLPATITNDGSLADTFHVAVKNYTQTNAQGAITYAVEEGMNRAWQITSNGGSPATISLQHNTVTNGMDYNTLGSDPIAFITQYEGGGGWDISTAGSYVVGTVTSSAKHTRSFASTATTCTDNKSWLTKSADNVTPLPIHLISFTGKAFDCKALLTWEATDANVDFAIERQQNPDIWQRIGTVKGNNTTLSSKYSFTDNFPNKKNLYRLSINGMNNETHLSNIISVDVDCNDQNTIRISPNPAFTGSKVVVQSQNNIREINIYDGFGRIINKFNVGNNDFIISTKGMAASTYYFQIVLENGTVGNRKVIVR